MKDYLKNACEEIDADIFSGDALWIPETKNELKEYVRRWAQAILEHESSEADRSEEKGSLKGG